MKWYGEKRGLGEKWWEPGSFTELKEGPWGWVDARRAWGMERWAWREAAARTLSR